ncbi:MAG: hypothetical protein JXA96_06380 [Sedimentisphaerales bacterium]|nr:hypothetical protein [Sedimentisphaerales bacterium]
MYKRIISGRISSFLISIAALLFLQGYCVKAQTTESRTISFPEGKPLGIVFLQDSNKSNNIDSSEWWWGNSPDWISAGNASGNISIPVGNESVLFIQWQDNMDLSPLGKLKPDDIDFLIIQCDRRNTKKPNDESLKYICHLTSLKTLILEQTDITNEGLKSLTKIPSLKRLYFNSQTLDDSGLANIAEIKSLKGLRFYSNKITNQGISYLTKLPLLEEFFPDSSNIDAECMVHIAKMPRLGYIVFPSNKFCDKKIISLKESSSLKKLEFLAPQISNEWLENLGKLNQVEYLAIKNIPLNDEDFKYLTSMSSLKSIFLQGNRPFRQPISYSFTDAGLMVMSQMKSLESINLFYGEFTDKGLEYLSKLNNLKTLIIPNCYSFTGSGLQYLTQLENLEHLNIGSYSLKDVDLESMGQLKNLKKLILFNANNITNKGLAKLTGLSSLENLELWAPKITTTGLNHLNALSNLTVLDVTGGYAKDIEPDDTILNIENLKNLEKLIIPVFRNEDLDCIEKLPNLRQLEIYNHGIVTNEGIARLKNLTSLHKLSFIDVYATDDGLNYISDLSKLSQLTISGDITTRGLSYLEKLENLTYLSIITPNSIEPEALQHFTDIIPSHPQTQLQLKELPQVKLQIGMQLPLEDIDIKLSPEELEGKRILLCLWDMEQRPSRNTINQLKQKADELKEKNISVIVTHIVGVEQAALEEWINDNNIPFKTGILKNKSLSEIINEGKGKPYSWETRSLPGLILTDTEHKIINLGFSITELDEII